MNRNMSGTKTYENNAFFFFLVKKLPINPQHTFLLLVVSVYVVPFSVRVRTVYAVCLTAMFQGFLFLSVAKARSLITKCHLITQQRHLYSQCV